MVAEQPRRIVRRPSVAASVLGGSIQLPPSPCLHNPARPVSPWAAVPGTAGTVAVVGAGKMGLPLAAQYASHGWRVVAVDIDPAVVATINSGQSHVAEPGVAELVREAHSNGRLSATGNAAEAARAADVVVLIVPVMLDDSNQPDYSAMDAAVTAIGPGIHTGQTVIFETTLPVGDTRTRYLPRLEATSGRTAEDDLFVAFSPERLFSGAVLQNLASYPKLVGGVGSRSGERAGAFYASVLDAEVVLMSSAETAEFAKLAETSYRDVNIAFANELAGYAERVGVDIQEVIAGANSQPYSHVHQPGIGVGGHCIPVYPHFLLSRAPELKLVARSREVNDGQVDVALDAVAASLGGLLDQRVLVLGLTYRSGVNELAYSRGVALVGRLREAGARVAACDPLLDGSEIQRLGAEPWIWGSTSPVRAIVTQTADSTWEGLDAGWFPNLVVLYDGRNSLRGLSLPVGVIYRGVGLALRGSSDTRETHPTA